MKKKTSLFMFLHIKLLILHEFKKKNSKIPFWAMRVKEKTNV